MPCYSWQPLQPDIFTYEIRTSSNRHPTLLDLPREIRDEIYFYIVLTEQENEQEYVGTLSKCNKSLMCTQLFQIRPPSLIRVCRALRTEYLPFYFRQTCFRIYVHIADDVESEFGLYPYHKQCLSVDKSAKDWLDSLKPSGDEVFRNIQFRLSYQGVGVGASFNVVFNAQARKYQSEFVIDDGWNVGLEIRRSGVRQEVHKILFYAAWAVKKACVTFREEFLNWNYIQHLTRIFDPSHIPPMVLQGIDPNGVDLRGWSDETGLDDDHPNLVGASFSHVPQSVRACMQLGQRMELHGIWDIWTVEKSESPKATASFTSQKGVAWHDFLL